MEAPQKIDVSNLQVPNYIGENEDNFHGMANGIKKKALLGNIMRRTLGILWELTGNPLETW